MFRPKRDNY